MARANSRVQSLDALRGIAVLGVFLLHFQSNATLGASVPEAWRAGFVFGMFGVDLFYVLSGFFITKAILSAPEWNPTTFLKARVFRIYPAYLVCLLILAFCQIITTPHVSAKFGVGLGLHLVMAHNFIPEVSSLFNGVFWTLGVEFPYYMLMLGLAPFIRNRHQFKTVTLVMLLVSFTYKAGVLVFLPLDGMNGLLRFFAATQIAGALDTFAIGGIAAYIVNNNPTGIHRKLPTLLSAIVLFSGAVAYLSAHTHDFWSDPFMVVGWRALLACSFAALILWLTSFPAAAGLRYTGLPWLGKISFSFYLWHYPVINSLNALNPLPALSTPVLQISYVILVSLALSWLSWRFVETRFHHMGVK